MKFITLLGLASATPAGIAMSAHERVLTNSKDALCGLVSGFLGNFKFEDFPIGENMISNARFQSVEMTPDDIGYAIEGDRIKFDINNIGGKFSGHSYKKRWFDEENFDFDFSMKKGGIKSMHIEFIISKQFVDGRTLPLLEVVQGHWEPQHNLWTLNIQSDDWQVNTNAWFLQTFKDVIIAGVKNTLNLLFPQIANTAVTGYQSAIKGQLNIGIIQSIADLLPENNIVIPDDYFINYAMIDSDRARIVNKRMMGYFDGGIMGFKTQNAMNRFFSIDEKYMTVGNLQLDENTEDAFQAQVSTRTVNEILEVILGTNQIPIDVANSVFVENGFPVPMTSDSLENAIPGLTDAIGYDVKLSARFKNVGAPRIEFKKHRTLIHYTMVVEIFDEHFENKYLEIVFNEVNVEMRLHLQNMVISTEWDSITMKNAEVSSDLLADINKERANKAVTDFFNSSLFFILPWINENPIMGVSQFVVPSEVPDIVRIHDLKLDIRDNYINLLLDPEFITEIPE